MKIMKPREASKELNVLRALNQRQAYSFEQKQNLLNMEKGLIGERQFDEMGEKYLEQECVMLQDLSLTIKGNTVQIDSVLLTSEVVYIFEVKNYEGDFIMKDGDIYTVAGQEISNPLTQLNRTSSLLRQLLQSWQVKMSIEGYVVFVNPACMLYHATPADPFIFYGQIQSRLTEINRRQRDEPWGIKKMKGLAEKLIEEHNKEGRIQIKRPAYTYEELRKGIRCLYCGKFDIRITQRRVYCKSCMQIISKDKVVISQIEEYFLLFPERKATVNNIYEWCGEKVNKERIQRILSTYYQKSALSVGTYYVQKGIVEEKREQSR
ncbi:nuclease-related domain-containing protein [Alkalibacterium thalassium]|uniref:Nuclease-related domain-containing protein n=1 Tax=Alkalibacterium thalassium TaxID=426701 RepID=A0A1G8XYK4_9LACT|nr:nuclease-related domain-containing protein [Alkalibacterium thalassium]SDJ95603.1 Nuclease-related domain-containing protein [Alkalibacterium thalassium]